MRYEDVLQIVTAARQMADSADRITEASDKIVQSATMLLEAMVAAEGRTMQKIAAEVRKVNEARALLTEYREHREDDMPSPGGRRVVVHPAGEEPQVIELPPDEEM